MIVEVNLQWRAQHGGDGMMRKFVECRYAELFDQPFLHLLVVLGRTGEREVISGTSSRHDPPPCEGHLSSSGVARMDEMFEDGGVRAQSGVGNAGESMPRLSIVL